MKKLLVLALSATLLVTGLPANAAVKAGASCSAVGSKKTSGDKEFTCIKKGSKLVWGKEKIVIISKKVIKTPIPLSASPIPVESEAPTLIATPTDIATPVSNANSQIKPPTPVVTVSTLRDQSNVTDIFVSDFDAGSNLENSYLVVRSVSNLRSGVLSSCKLQGKYFKGSTGLQTQATLNKENRSGVLVKLSVVPNTYQCGLVRDTEYEIYLFIGDSKGKMIAVSDSVQIIIGDLNKPTPSPSPSPTKGSSFPLVTAGAFCAPAGATGQTTKGVIYTCKTSDTETRNRWRQ